MSKYRTMRGRTLDMSKIQKKNELAIAAGNASVNARGDVIGKAGKIVKTREQVVKQHYHSDAKIKVDQNAPTVAANPEPAQVNEPTVSKTTSRAKTKSSKVTKPATPVVDDLTDAEKEMMAEVQEQDEWLEDENGNFVKGNGEK